MNPQVTDYINEAPSTQRMIMEEIRQLIHSSVPEVQESIKWSRPVFSSDKSFVYLKTAKAYVSLGFFKSEKLEEYEHLLEGTGKDMRHIKIKKPEEIDKVLLSKWFKILATD